MARRTLWLTDAYYAGTTPYVQALRGRGGTAWTSGCSCPAHPTFRSLRPFSRAGYRPLLEAGVRVFEWNGSMLHAKTAVADGRWARVGSTNLNIASWIGNRELDVVVEDEPFAGQMEAMFLDDLGNATEIVLDARNRVRAPRRATGRPPLSAAAARQRRPRRRRRGAHRQHRVGGDHESPRARARRGAHRADRGPAAWRSRRPRFRLSARHQLPDRRHRGLVVPRIAVSRVRPLRSRS